MIDAHAVVRGLRQVLGAVGDERGRHLPDVPSPASRRRSRAGGDDQEDEGAPWHFKLLIVAVVVYLVWRAYQLIAG